MESSSVGGDRKARELYVWRHGALLTTHVNLGRLFGRSLLMHLVRRHTLVAELVVVVIIDITCFSDRGVSCGKIDTAKDQRDDLSCGVLRSKRASSQCCI